MRSRETRILQRILAIEREAQIEIWSKIPITNFYGIEIADFAAETAKLALFIAEQQANAAFGEAVGRPLASLPLKEAAHITFGNSLQIDWYSVCPSPGKGEEVYIVGNPPFLGTTFRNDQQKADMATVFGGYIESYGRLDFSAAWMYLASKYINNGRSKSALITTSSTVQGSAVSPLWGTILAGNTFIDFCHRPFKWKNNAVDPAAVECVIVGLSTTSAGKRTIYENDTKKNCDNINAYLIGGPNVFVDGERSSLFGLDEMGPGNFPYDFGHLILTDAERLKMIEGDSRAEKFIYKFIGSKEVIHRLDRYCLWIDDEDLADAKLIKDIAARIEKVAEARSKSTDAGTRRLASRPHQFREHVAPKGYMTVMPRTSSEKRDYLPVDKVSGNVVSSDNNHVLYDVPDWCVALLASRMHLTWIAAVCGRLEARFRYSNTLGWYTFPVPKFTQDQMDALSNSAIRILRVRYAYYPATIAELYDPEKMPDDLRQAHKNNDDLLEAMYIGRPFRNDTERLERLFKLYAAREKQDEA